MSRKFTNAFAPATFAIIILLTGILVGDTNAQIVKSPLIKSVPGKSSVSPSGNFVLRVPPPIRPVNSVSPIKGRFLFYNNSSFDSVADGDAIAPDKQPLFDDQTATADNYSSYSLGINGVMIDIESLNGEVDAGDFEFKVGNIDDSDDWTEAPAPDSISTSPGEGIEGSDRITIVWPDGAIKSTWLQVRVLGNTTTKLAEDDVFYFGNVVGETTDSTEHAFVNASDIGAIRSNLSGFFLVGIESEYDINRDGRVNASDIGIVRNNLSGFFPVSLITPSSSDRPGIGFERGVNFGNMLEAPSEGAWGLTVEERFFDLVVESGMDHIRLPISWTHHTSQTAPYTIDETFFSRIDWCVDHAVSRGLKIIVNVHHYDELNTDPIAETPRAIAMWEQIATRYASQPKSVYFEVLNEPHDQFSANTALWDTYLGLALAKIRESNPTRKVLIGGPFFNSIGGLVNFDPPDDPFLIASFHFYEPFAFTHQGAEWVDPSPPIGTMWINERVNFASNFQSWSWSTEFTPAVGSLGVEYTGGWAGVRFHANSPVDGTDNLKFTIDQAMSLRVTLRDVDDNAVFQEDFQTSSGANEYSFDFDVDAPIADVIIQNLTPDAQAQYQLSNAILSGANQSVPLLESEEDAVANAFMQAQMWSIVNGIPVHMGEFGAYNPADIDSRERWTTAVRVWAETLDIPFSYWEFGAGFGVYDPNGNAWRTRLIQSLIPEFQP